ncbi:hypothetical protein [Rhizobium phage RHph_N46]|nr:hypothetical protein [Rhizobium phage RHph_N46]
MTDIPVVEFKYPALMLAATENEKAGNYLVASRFYGHALHCLLFTSMLDVWNKQVQTVQELRFACYRKLRES